MLFHYQVGSLVDRRASKPYTLAGPPALRLVLDPLAVLLLNNRLYIPCVYFIFFSNKLTVKPWTLLLVYNNNFFGCHFVQKPEYLIFCLVKQGSKTLLDPVFVHLEYGIASSTVTADLKICFHLGYFSSSFASKI